MDVFLYTHNCAKRSDLIVDPILSFDAADKFADAIFAVLPGSKSKKNYSQLYAFGFQEMISIEEQFSPTKANEAIKGLGNVMVTLLKSKYGNDIDFQVVSSCATGAVGLVIISPYKSKFSDIQVARANCGFSWSNLKGGCGVRMKYKANANADCEISIGNFHLSAHKGEKQRLRRNQDWLNIVRSMSFSDGWGLIKPKNHTFLLGDFNYRSEYTDVYDPELDELQVSKARGDVFWGFEEPPILFKQTYKFYLSSESDDDYTPNRVPSWCDRILYRSYNTSSAASSASDVAKSQKLPEIKKYNSIPQVNFSDHKPVFLQMTVPISPPSDELVDDEGILIMPHSYNGKISLLPSTQDKLTQKYIAAFVDSVLRQLLYMRENKIFGVVLGMIIFLIVLLLLV